MDKIIDFNELKNRVNDKDVDHFESYIYSLYYKMAEGKINMAEFSRELGEFIPGFEEQLKSLGLENISTNPADYERTRRTLSFQEKYKSRLKVKGATEYSIKNDKNNLTILLDAHNVILKSEGLIDLTDNELNEFLCSYKKTVDNDLLKISICENSKEYDY